MTVNLKIKKTISIVIAIVMLISCVPLSGFAADVNETVVNGEFTFSVTLDASEGTGSAVITKYNGNDSYVIIPETCEYTVGNTTYILKVFGVGDNAFANNQSIETVRGGDIVRTIGKSAFSGCSKLSTCIFTSNTILDESAFAECPSLDIIAFNSVVHAPIQLEKGDEETLEDYQNRLTKATDDLIKSIFKDSAIPRYTFSNTQNLKNYSGSLINGGIVKAEPYIYGSIVGKNTVLLGITEPGKLADENKHLSLDASVKEIASSAFRGHTEIIDFDMPEKLEKIGSMAFENCSGLEKINLPVSMNYIGHHAFSNCIGLTVLDIPDNIKTIGASAFSGCTGLKTISVGSGLDVLEYRVFADCTGINNITFKDGLKEIGTSAFENCDGIKALTFPTTIEKVGSSSFLNCTGIETVEIPAAGKYEIAVSAFQNCSGIKSVDFGSNLSAIGKNAFANCTSLEALTDFDTCSALKSISEETFINCKALDNVKIPENVLAIDDCAFSGCDKLKTLELNEKLSKIGKQVFENCTSLVSLEVFDDVTVIKEAAFSGCSNLENVVIGNSVTEISDSLFKNCVSLSSLTLGAAVTSVGNNAFENCSSLTHALILDEVTLIKDNTFAGCSSLESVEFGKNVTAIGNSAFEGCSALTEVEIPAKVTSIGNRAFADCTSLEKIVVPASVTEIGTDAFAGCDNVTIYCYSNSAALEYAKEYGFNYIIIDCAHTNTEWITDIPATCTEEGSEHEACTECGSNLQTRVIPATGHTESDWIIDKEANCTETGSKHKVCTVCSYQFEAVEIPALGHTESDWILDYNATATTEGKKHTVCTVCGEMLNVEVIAPFGGDFDYKIISEEDKTCVIIGYLGDEADVVIPEQLNGYTVVEIGASSFEGEETVTSVTVPDSVKTISDSAFLRCKKLSEVNLGAGLEEIGQQAFYGCDALTQIILPEGIKTIKNDAFRNNANLSKVNLPDSLEYIAPYAFAGCPDLVDNVEYNKGTYAEKYVIDNNLVSSQASKKIVKIEITSLPAKTVYKIGEKLDLTGLVVTATYSDGTKGTIDNYGYSGFESSTAGERSVIISKDGCTVSFKYTVTGKLGDVNFDGKVSIVDAKRVLQEVAGTRTFNSAEFAAADVNKDGKISIVDAKQILKIVAQQ